ncbi:hypothetical protein [Siminovitchia sp. 179-K 8D1 HS]|uniref:hypothetical protein n=1 Tax=Siminovitchia sp. 179-K 8D1 HS TaxID=3142385 RepID=UPI0039A2BDDF
MKRENLNLNGMLDELYALTKEEQNRVLSDIEKDRYIFLVNILQANDVEIDFGINI